MTQETKGLILSLIDSSENMYILRQKVEAL